jgi:hypothetical protein
MIDELRVETNFTFGSPKTDSQWERRICCVNVKLI